SVDGVYAPSPSLCAIAPSIALAHLPAHVTSSASADGAPDPATCCRICAPVTYGAGIVWGSGCYGVTSYASMMPAGISRAPAPSDQYTTSRPSFGASSLDARNGPSSYHAAA